MVQCLERCRWELIAERPDCQCQTPFMPVAGYPECSEFGPATTVMEIYQGWSDPTAKLECRQRCPRPCQTSVYEAQAS